MNTETPTTLPDMPAHPYGPDGRGRVFAFMTGERVTTESAKHGDAAEHGWVSPTYSRTTFFDSRNDVAPVMSEDTDSDELADAVRDALDELGVYTDNGNGTFYSADAIDYFDYYSPEGSYSYAIHFVVKYRTGRATPGMGNVPEYAERAWHPADAGIDLTN